MISMHHGEELLNHGSKSNLRLKGHEDLSLLQFDVAALKGKIVEEAKLVFFPFDGHKLKSIGISTVGTPWKEGEGASQPAKPGEPCFVEAARGERPWAHPGSDLHAVTYGRGGSIWAARDLRPEPDGWASVEVPSAILHALVEGNSFGIALSDEKGQTGHNNAIYSKEQSAKAPYLLVTKRRDGTPPASGAKKYVPPAPKAVADRSGEFLKKSAAAPPPAPAALADGARYRILHEGETRPDAPSASRLWDGRAISLAAARGEHVGFMISLEVPAGTPRPVEIGGAGWTASRVLPVGPSFDPLVPAAGEVAGRALYHVERYVAKNAPAGEQKLALDLKVGSAEVAIPVSLRVHAAVLPDVLGFQVSLNTYHSPGRGNLELDRSFHRLAHEHRATLAIVPYSHRGNVEGGMAPEIKRDGARVEIVSWKAYDERWAPYFDGSAFKGLPREGIPLDHFYWPHHEQWPLPINDFYSYKGKVDDHWRDAPPAEKAFSEPYGKTFRDTIAAFGKHAAEKGWTKTEFHVFLNNKPDIRFQRRENEGAWWRLDEPLTADDHLAIRYFALLSKEAARETKGVDIKFRADLSRPQVRRDWLDGLIGLDVVAGSYRQYPELVFGRGEDVWIYGGLPNPGGSGEWARAWCLQTFLDGADGLLPWLATGDVRNWTEPADTALVLPPKPGMESRAYATLRLKTLRRGQQDVELLRLLLAKMKASREEIRKGLAETLGLAPDFHKTSEVDAGRLDYKNLDSDRFECFRRSVLAALEK
jgi:hypothetical protein